jgi:hypothetical protein
MDDKESIPRRWFRDGVADFLPLFTFTFKSYSLVGFMLVIDVTVIQFTEMRAC